MTSIMIGVQGIKDRSRNRKEGEEKSQAELVLDEFVRVVTEREYKNK